jgi:hypothetical protein
VERVKIVRGHNFKAQLIFNVHSENKKKQGRGVQLRISDYAFYQLTNNIIPFYLFSRNTLLSSYMSQTRLSSVGIHFFELERSQTPSQPRRGSRNLMLGFRACLFPDGLKSKKL